MKKRRPLEADLDPPNTPRTRPGGETVKRAHALAKAAPLEGAKARKTRPGAHAAERAHARAKRGRVAS
jgi:hypothetical protein